MTVYVVGFIICAVLFGICLALCLGNFLKDDTKDKIVYIGGIAAVIGILCCIVGVAQGISLRQETIRQNAEREQILYQVENLTDDKDKVKINEWILSYNDWVNDVNAEKTMWGWFAWHEPMDMSKHTIIDLV